jgi:integrase
VIRSQASPSIVDNYSPSTIWGGFMSTIFFHSKRKTYYSRSYIPTNLRQLLSGRLELWRSLGTADKDEAAVRAAQWDSRIKRVFVTLKKDGHCMTQAQIDALVESWLESELDYAEDCRAVAGPVSDYDRESQLIGLDIMNDEAHEALLGNDFTKIEKDARELLKAAGLTLDPQGAEFGRLCRRLLRARIEYTQIEAERWNGVYNDRRPEARRFAERVATPAAAPAVKSSNGPLFSVVMDKYLAENPRAARTAKPMRVELMKFIEATGGDRAIDRITKADGRTYKEHLLNDRKASLLTVVKHLSALSVVFKWAESNGYMTDGSNIMKGLTPNKKAARKQAVQRRPFTDAELLTVLGSKEFIAQRETNPDRWWIVLLCLFTAARREEVAQFALSDIGSDDGIHFLKITDEGKDQTLKNEGSRRRVPVHSALVQLGFLDYVARMRKANHFRLFPQLKKGQNGYSDPCGKWFGRLVTKCGLTDPALVLHGLRHGGITKLHAAGVADDVVKMLVGHSDQTVHGQTYLHRNLIPLKLLRDGLEKLRYDIVMKALHS